MCEHRYLDDPNGLPCDRHNYDGRGHTYTATTASHQGEGGHRTPEPTGDDQ